MRYKSKSIKSIKNIRTIKTSIKKRRKSISNHFHYKKNIKNKTIPVKNRKTKIKRMNASKRGRKMNGSGAIAAGGYGCVFRPALKCKGASRRTSGISKLMLSKYAKDEFNEIEKIKKTLVNIKNNEKYFIISGIEICEPDQLSKQT